MRINRMTSLAVIAASVLAAGCGEMVAVQCIEDTNCDLSAGGVCASAPTGHRWCAYPNASCQSGLRYSENGKYVLTGTGSTGPA